MDVACQTCSAMYPISEQKLAGRVVRFRCKHCGSPILVDGRANQSSPPSAGSVPPPSSATALASAPGRTVMAHGAPPLPAAVFAPGYGAHVAAGPAATPQAPRQGGSSMPGLGHSAGPGVPPFGLAPVGFDTSDVSAAAVPLTRPVHAVAASVAPGPSMANGSKGPYGVPASSPHQSPSSPSSASQPRPTAGGWDIEVDPSVYEDETVAMTASELEAAADAKSFIPPAAPAPLPFRGQPPPKPWSGAPPSSSNPSATGSFGLPIAASPLGSGFPPHTAAALPPGSGPVSSGPMAFSPPALPNRGAPLPLPAAYPAPSAATRAESWALGRSPTPGVPPQSDRMSPAAPSARTWNSVEPSAAQRKENRWMFPLLLVTLGLGGLVVGGVLGKTWIAHVMNPGPTPAAPVVDPNLPPFAPLDANMAMEKAQADAVHCLTADAAPLTGLIVARFTPAGVLEQLQMNGSLGSAPEAPCVRSVFEKVRVAPFSGPPAQVEKAVELKPQP